MARFLTPLVLALHPAAALGAALLVPPVALAAPQETYGEFRDRFEKALDIGAKDEIRRLFTSHEAFAIDLVVHTSEAIAGAPSERVALRMEAIHEAWNATKQGDFVKNMERYFSNLDTPTATERRRIKAAYDKGTQNFAEVEAAKDKGKLNGLAGQFRAWAEAFEQTGDKFLAGNAWLYQSLCLDERHQGPDADLRAVAAAYRKLIDLRTELDLKDRFYRETMPNLQRLEGLGFGAPKEGGGEAGAGGGPVAASGGAAVVAPAAFEPVLAIDGVFRPNYFLDEHYPVWDSLQFGEVGSSTTLKRIEGSPKFTRSGSTRIEVDLDGDGKYDAEVPARGRLEPFTFELGSGASKRKWSMLVQAGNQTDQYQGIELSNAASDGNWSVFLAPGASTVADVGGVRLQVFDDNMDGVYGSPALSYGHMGLTSGLFQPEYDTVLIGDAKRAVPWSEFQKLPTGWAKIESQDGGTKFAVTPTTMRTGKLKLAAKGVAPEFLIVQGMNDFEKSFFDLTTAKEVEVPVGRYRVYCGVVAKGAKKQRMKALVMAGENAKTYEVMEGQTVEVPFGAPYDFVCAREVGDEAVTVNGNSVALVGAGGERYERFYLCVPRPEVAYREKGEKRGSKPLEMAIIQDRDGFDRKGGYAAMWKPLDLVVPKKKDEKDIELQLTEKKNKLFGKIDGTWK